MWNHNLMLVFVSAHIPWNVLSHPELWPVYNAFWCDLVLPSDITLSIISPRQYALTMDAIKKQLPSQNKACLALDGWTVTHQVAITSVTTHYRDQNWALGEEQLAFDEVDSLFFSMFKSQLMMIRQVPTYWSKASHTCEGRAWSFWAYRRPIAREYHL